MSHDTNTLQQAHVTVTGPTPPDHLLAALAERFHNVTPVQDDSVTAACRHRPRAPRPRQARPVR
ncbi:hypothetical protein GXW82_33175 [Streptacidiphilus sp. 4-A2]|nr:hypothetical protein [Streptacidiphilus sp. 4-A2]